MCGQMLEISAIAYIDSTFGKWEYAHNCTFWTLNHPPTNWYLIFWKYKPWLERRRSNMKI